MAGVEGTGDNQAVSRFGKVNEARLADKEKALCGSIGALEFKSGPNDGQLSSDLFIIS